MSTHSTHLSAPLAASVARVLLPQDSTTSGKATLLNNLATYLSASGKREKALVAAQQAVGIRKILAEQQPEVFIPNLAISLRTCQLPVGTGGTNGECQLFPPSNQPA